MRKKNKILLILDITAAALALVKAVSLYRKNAKIQIIDAAIDET